MFDNKECLRNLEYDFKYSDMINKFELKMDYELNKNNVFKGVGLYETI